MTKFPLLFLIVSSVISFQAKAAGCMDDDVGFCARPDAYILTLKKLELCTGAPNTSVYDVTCNDAVTVGTGSLEFDVTSVNAGKTIATFASTKGLPIGTTFTHIKPTLSREIKLKGSVPVSSGGVTYTCHTDSNAGLNGASKYERVPAGKMTGSPTLASYYFSTSSGGLSQNAANLFKLCLSTDCTSTYTWSTYNVALPVTEEGFFGISVEDVTSSDEEFSIIYALSKPYTVSEVAPKINMAFGTAMSLSAIDYNNGASCAITPYHVKVQITITE